MSIHEEHQVFMYITFYSSLFPWILLQFQAFILKMEI